MGFAIDDNVKRGDRGTALLDSEGRWMRSIRCALGSKTWKNEEGEGEEL